MKTRFLMAAKSIVILLLTFGTRSGNCDIKSVGMIEDIPKTAVERRTPFQNEVDIPNARNDMNRPYVDAKTEKNKYSISFQSNMKQFYHTDSKFHGFDSLTSKKKNIRFKRFVPSDDSNSTTTTTSTPDNLDIEYPNGPDNFDSIFETRENNDTFEILPTPVYGDYGGRVMINIEPIDTLEQAESLLFGDEAQRFLDEFTNEMQRDVVENHILYCPYTPLCSFKYENLYLDRRNYKSPCVTCLCENCNTADICCPDKVDFNKPRRSSNTECKQMSLKDSGNYYEIVTTCSSSLNIIADDPCISDQNSNTFSDILPVTDTTTNITYRNRKCAICNQVAKAKLVIWQPQLICVKTDAVPSMLKSEKDLIQFAKNSRYCDITYFMPDESVDPVICEQVVSECNVTGNWSIYDHFISTACSAYQNIYMVDLGGYETKLHRNIFCALCNGENPNAVRLSKRSLDPGSISMPQVYAFSGLLKFGGDEDEHTVDTDDRCDAGYIYDRIQETCMELECSPLRILKNNRCEPLFSEIRNIVYELTLRLYPIRGWNTDFDDLSFIYVPIYIAIGDRMQELLAALTYSYNFNYGGYGGSPTPDICSMNLFRSKNEKCANDSCFWSDEENFFEVELKFHVTDSHGIDDIVQLAVDLEADSLDILVNVTVYKFEVQKRDLGRRAYSPNQSFITVGVCSASTELVKLSKQNTCPLVSISIDDNACFEYMNGVICSTIDMTLNVSEYHFDTNGSGLFVCSDVYLNYFAHFTEEKKPITSPLNASVLLSLVCIIISLVCLAVSFMTFCLFPRLRTLPGKNNMSLIMALMIAQVMFLISSFGQLNSGSVGCKLVGLLTHFFWLAAVFWMNICTFHVFRVFTGIEALSVDSDIKSFVMYSVYASALPVCLVVINVVVSLISSDGTHFGYGKSTCYISSEKMVGFTFGVPVGIVIISNFIMFAFFIYKIKTAPSVSKDVKNERNDIIIFAKLSTLTGFTWIFGFIYSWTDVEVFSYLFIILNATQGVFLFLSFVCNKRVLTMYKNRSFGETSSSEAYKSRMTESTSQSSVRKA